MPAIREVIKGLTLATNEPEWLQRALYEEEVTLGIDPQQYDYVAFAVNGDVYGIYGDSEARLWRAILHEKVSSGEAKANPYKAMLEVEEVKPGGLSICYNTKKKLLSEIEGDTLQFAKERVRSGSSNIAGNEESRSTPSSPAQNQQAKIEYGMTAPSAYSSRSSTRNRSGVKRIGFAMLLALVGLLLPALSLVVVPLLISGSEAALKEQVKEGHEAKQSVAARLCLAAGVLLGLLGIALPFFTFLSALFIIQGYNLRCKDMYKRLTK